MFESSNGDNFRCWKAYGSTVISKKSGTDSVLVLGGTSGGYIFGFIIMTFFCGLGIELGIELGNKKNKIVFSVLFGLIGLLSCHILGIIQLKLVLKCTWVEAALWGSVPHAKGP